MIFSASAAFDEAARLAEAADGTLVATGSYTPPRRAAKFKGAGVGPTPAYSYSACVVELQVDPETGVPEVVEVAIACAAPEDCTQPKPQFAEHDGLLHRAYR